MFALSTCGNLKKLTLFGTIVKNDYALDWLSEEDMNKLVPPASLKVSPKLEEFHAEYIYGFLPIQNWILELCSKQLKRIKVFEWCTGACEDLDNLEQLDLTRTPCGNYGTSNSFPGFGIGGAPKLKLNSFSNESYNY